MGKIGLDKGLISYSTLGIYDDNMALASTTPKNMAAKNEEEFSIAKMAAIDPKKVRDDSGKLFNHFVHASWSNVVRLRTIIYTAIYCMIGLALIVSLLTRSDLDVNVLHDRNPIFVTLSDGSIRNGYEIKILNMVAQPSRFNVRLEGIPSAFVKIAGDDKNLGQNFAIDVESDKLRATRIYVTVPKADITGTNMKFKLVVNRQGEKEEATYDANFVTSNGAKR